MMKEQEQQMEDHYLNAATVSVMRPKEAKNSQMMKEQEQQMEYSLPECCHCVCDKAVSETIDR